MLSLFPWLVTSLGTNIPSKCIPAIRDDRTTLGLRSTSKYSKKSSCISSPTLTVASLQPANDLRLLHALRTSQYSSRSPGLGPNPAHCSHYSWNPRHSATNSMSPSSCSCQPISSSKDYFKLADKKEGIFLR